MCKSEVEVKTNFYISFVKFQTLSERLLLHCCSLNFVKKSSALVFPMTKKHLAKSTLTEKYPGFAAFIYIYYYSQILFSI